MIRNLSSDDYDYVISRINNWWGGRNVMDMLPRLFFDHFCNTSFAYIDNGQVVGFLVGFLSDSNSDVAYIHFSGVDPEYRKRGLASDLYAKFISLAKSSGRKYVKCVTSPSNKGSLAYHHKVGFTASDYDSNGFPVAINNYDGEDNHRVVLTLTITT